MTNIGPRDFTPVSPLDRQDYLWLQMIMGLEIVCFSKSISYNCYGTWPKADIKHLSVIKDGLGHNRSDYLSSISLSPGWKVIVHVCR